MKRNISSLGYMHFQNSAMKQGCRTFQTFYFQAVWIFKTDTVRSQWWEVHNKLLNFCLSVLYRSTMGNKSRVRYTEYVLEQCNVNTYWSCTNSSLQNRQHVTDTGTVQCDYLLQFYEQQLIEQTACDRYSNSAMCLLTAAVWTAAYRTGSMSQI